MDFEAWATSSFNEKDSFADRNDSFIVEVAKVGWEACQQHSVPRIEYDAYAKSYCIVTEDSCYYWNPPGVSLVLS